MQSPFKWYNWNPPNLAVNFKSPANFGTANAEPSTVGASGVPLSNVSPGFRWYLEG